MLAHGVAEQEAPELDQNAVADQPGRLRERGRPPRSAGTHIEHDPALGDQVGYAYEDQGDANVGPAVYHLPGEEDALERQPLAERQLAVPDNQEDGDGSEHPQRRRELHASQGEEAQPRWSPTARPESLLRRHTVLLKRARPPRNPAKRPYNARGVTQGSGKRKLHEHAGIGWRRHGRIPGAFSRT